MEHSNNISTIDNLAKFIVSTNDNMRNNGMTGKSKGDLMKVVYGENYSSVDSALPLGLLEEMNINNDERWRYVMDYQNGSGGKLTDLINSLAQQNPNVVIYDNEYEEVDNLPILSAMKKYKNSNYMFDFDMKYNNGGGVNKYSEQIPMSIYEGVIGNFYNNVDYINWQGDNYIEDGGLEMQEEMYSIIKKYIDFDTINGVVDFDDNINNSLSKSNNYDESIVTANLSFYKGKKLVAKLKSFTTYNESNDEGLTKETIFFDNDDFVNIQYTYGNTYTGFDPKRVYEKMLQNELQGKKLGFGTLDNDNEYKKGGNVNDYFAILTEQLESKYGGDSMTSDLDGRFTISKIKNGIEVITDSEAVFNEIKEDYANDILFEYPIYYQLEIKDSNENIQNINLIMDKENIKIKEKYPKLKRYSDAGMRASWKRTYDRIVVKTADLETFEEIQNNLNDGEILYVFPPMYKLEIGDNDYKGDINNNDITYYNVGIDEGEDIGTRTLEFFDTKAEAQAFMDKFLLSNPNAKLFIDVEKRQPILDSRDNPRNEVTTNKLYRRLQFINEDINRVFKYAPKELLDFKVEGWEDIGTLLSNIDIASDLTDNASDDWKVSKINMATGGSVNDYIDEQVDEFDADETEMRQQYRGYVRDIEYQGFLAIDTSLTPYERLSDYEFDGEEFDRDNLLEVAKMYPQAEYITFHARLMGDSDFGIEDELSPIDDLAMSFNMDKLNQFKKGGVTGKDNRAKKVVRNVNGFDRKEHSQENKSQKYEVPISSRKMAKGGSVELANEKYLNSIPLDKKTQILQNIADHYGISEEQAYAEVTDNESEALYEYITNENLRMHVYQMMK